MSEYNGKYAIKVVAKNWQVTQTEEESNATIILLWNWFAKKHIDPRRNPSFNALILLVPHQYVDLL